MHTIRFGFPAVVALLVSLPTTSSAQGPDAGPCSDSLYVALKQRPVDSLSVREYELFRDRDRACLQRGAVPGPIDRATPATTADAASVASAREAGRELAGAQGTSGWFFGGVGSGIVLGLIGTAIVTIAADNSGSDLPASSQSLVIAKPPAYARAFTSAYQERMKSRNRKAALGGGLLGTAALVIAVVSAQGGD